MYLCWLRAGTFPEGQTYLIFHLWPEGENIELWDQAWISSPRVDDESIICSKNHLKADSLVACIYQAPVFHSNPAEKWYDPCRLQRASPLTVVLKSVGLSASPGNPLKCRFSESDLFQGMGAAFCVLASFPGDFWLTSNWEVGALVSLTGVKFETYFSFSWMADLWVPSMWGRD